MTGVASAPIMGVLDGKAIQEFRERLRGTLLQPGDPGYDDARTIWNAMIDRRPALIARCRGAADVIASVNFAREHSLLVSIKGGGHNVAGNAVCDGGLMIDLSPMKSVRVDPVARTATAEPGVLWGEFDRETQAFGLATPGGVVNTTGIAGLTLGGGQSWLTGKYGLTLDNLLSVDMVTAAGELMYASETENPDLFWAVRGAGANFGVVTSFEYRVHPIGPVLGGMVIHPLDRAVEVLRFYREFVSTQPDELTTLTGILTSPDGQPLISVVSCYCGEHAEGARVLEPLRRFGPPLADTIGSLSYTEMQAVMSAGFPHGRLNYWKSNLTNQITDDAIETIVEHAHHVPSPFSAIAIGGFLGAYLRVGKTDTAYYHRDLPYALVTLSSWTDPAESQRNIDWTRGLFQALQPQVSGGVYVNDLGNEGSERVRNAYGANYDRLVEFKTKYDPNNFFRMNQNIAPK